MQLHLYRLIFTFATTPLPHGCCFPALFSHSFFLTSCFCIPHHTSIFNVWPLSVLLHVNYWIKDYETSKMLHSSMVPQGWWPLQCFLYSLTSVYLSSVNSVYFFTAWYCELGITSCFYVFHASLFPLKLLRCVRTWIFNGLLILGCI